MKIFLLMYAFASQPDLQLESQLHDIYVNYHNQKMSSDEWHELVGTRASESYQIQNHDTLWGVSKVFFGDGNYWPKIWSVNSEIVNPHLITEGNSIRFILGDESDAPSFTITENGEEGDDKPAKTKRVSRNEEDEIPTATQEFKPVLRTIPDSLPNWMASKTSLYGAKGVSFQRVKRKALIDRSYLPSYITQTFPQSLGHIVEVEGANFAAAQNQYVFIESTKGNIQVGDVLTAIKDRGKIKSEVNDLERMGLERVIEIQGQMRVIERVESVKQSSPYEVFRALVEKSITTVTAQSDLVKSTLSVYEFSSNGPRSQIVAQIIGGVGSEEMNYYGDRSIVYINRGSDDGVSINQILPVRSTIVVRNPSTIVKETVAPIGYMKVINIQPRFATAVIVRAFQEIRTGDVTGQGGLHPDTRVSDNRVRMSSY